jgi:RNA polymerase sigma factor (sigma-70 family)
LREDDVDDGSDLVRAAADGDGDAWARLVARYEGLVWATARGFRLSRSDAEDVSQTAWLRLAESLHRIEHPERVGGWLATTTRREALRILEAAARTSPRDDVDDLAARRANVVASVEVEFVEREQQAFDVENARRLWRALDGLSERCQRLLRALMASPPPSYAEVSAAIDIPVGSIGPTRQRCLRQLRMVADSTGITGGTHRS